MAPAPPDPADARRDLVEILRYATDHLPPGERYRAWLRRDWPRSDLIYRTEPTEPFNTRWGIGPFGPVLFAYVEISAMRWERRLQDIRTSDFDPIIVNMMMEGEAQGDFDGRAFHERSGDFHFHDLARRSLHASSASRTYTIVIPRPLAREYFGSLQDIHGLVIRGATAGMLIAHARHAHGTARVTAPRLPRVWAGACSRSSPRHISKRGRRTARPCRWRPSCAAASRTRSSVGSGGNGRLSVAELGRATGISRARLFAAFKPDGGVQNYIARIRLDRARAALADLERNEPIGTIAERLGFSDASHLSRSFRDRYGMTPREYRQLVATDRTPDGGAMPEAPGG